jgi:Pyridine nucleotide-disulphide oxidoreductase
VVLADGTAIDADLVVVGIGISPNTDWLRGCGLEIDNGIVCDETDVPNARILRGSYALMACWMKDFAFATTESILPRLGLHHSAVQLREPSTSICAM